MDTATIFFHSSAGLVLEHAREGYAELRYLPSKRQPGELAALLTHLGRLLLARGWHKFLADNRQMTPYSADEKQSNPSTRPTGEAYECLVGLFAANTTSTRC